MTRDELLQLIDQAAREGWTKLDLRCKEILDEYAEYEAACAEMREENETLWTDVWGVG